VTAVTALTDQYTAGLLDTSVVIDLQRASELMTLPDVGSVCAITLAELSYGVALAPDPLEAARRAQRYARVRAWMHPLPFDELAADKYGELAALVRAHGRQPRSRRMDLMIAAVAMSNSLPLFTLNPDDFAGLEPALTVVAPDPRLRLV